MEKQRPKNGTYDIFANMVCLVLLTGIVVYLIVVWGSLPEKIPGHYSAVGAVDRWGNKGELIILSAISWILYLLVTIVERFPQIWNTGVTITEENKERVYRNLKRMISTTKLIMVVAFTFITLHSAVAIALPVWFLPVFLFLCCGSVIFFIVKIFKAR